MRHHWIINFSYVVVYLSHATPLNILKAKRKEMMGHQMLQ